MPKENILLTTFFCSTLYASMQNTMYVFKWAHTLSNFQWKIMLLCNAFSCVLGYLLFISQ